MLKADFLGVYSSQNQLSTAGAKNLKQKHLWFVWKVSSGEYVCQPIDGAYHTKGAPRKLAESVFNTSFNLEPKIFAAPLTALDPSAIEGFTPEPVKKVQVDEALPEQEEVADDFGLSPAQILDSQLREEFALYVQKLKRGKKNDALAGITEILERKQGIITAHKHLYTELGIELRELRLFDLALASFQKAYELSQTDPNTIFNLARINYQMGKHKEAKEYIDKVLALEPDHPAAKNLQEYLKRHQPMIRL